MSEAIRFLGYRVRDGITMAIVDEERGIAGLLYSKLAMVERMSSLKRRGLPHATSRTILDRWPVHAQESAGILG